MAGAVRKASGPQLSPLGERIDAFAAMRGLGRAELAERAGITRQALGAIIRGGTKSPSAGSAMAIAKALGITVEALFQGTGETGSSKLGRPALIPLSPFGAVLIRRMDVLGLTRDDLSKKTGIHGVTIWRWMRGKSRVPFDSACKLARVLRVPVTELQPGIR